MPTHRADDLSADQLSRLLAAHDGLSHLRVRRRGSLLTIESGPDDDAWPHARLRREGVHLWRLEFPAHGGRWDSTPMRSQMPALVEMLVSQFGWMLSDISGDKS